MRALLIAALLVLAVSPAWAQLSDRTGLVSRFDVEYSGRQHEVSITANFDATGARYDQASRTLEIDVSSSLEGNLGELVIPRQLLDGVEVRVDGEPAAARAESSELVWFVTVEFDGAGRHLMEVSEPAGGGCLVATAAYGTELAPAVQRLREARELAYSSGAGARFMDAFNALYYAVSPAVADAERQSPHLRALAAAALYPAVAALQIAGLAGSEGGAAVFGSLSLLACAGLYAGPPAAAAALARRLRSTRR